MRTVQRVLIEFNNYIILLGCDSQWELAILLLYFFLTGSTVLTPVECFSPD